MNSDVKSRRQSVSIDQMNGLLEFLQEHHELAKGLNRGRRGKVHSVKLWNLCAKKLNALNDDAVKDGKGWSKYWCDWKYRVRRKALELKAAKESDRPASEGLQPLTGMEESILGLIGGNAVDGVVIKTDPLAEDFEEADVIDNDDNNEDITSAHGSVAVTQCFEKQSKSHKRRRRLSSSYSSGMEEAPSTGNTSKRRVQPAENGNIERPDHENETAEFLRLETQNLENSKKILDSVQTIASQLTRLVDVMSQIRDIIAGNGQTRILDKEDKLTDKLTNDINEKTTEKLIYIDLPTSIPPREILKKSIQDEDIKIPPIDKDINIKCTDTELSDNTIDTDESKPCIPEVKDEIEKPLKLTTFIKEGRTDEARKACRVDSSLFLGVESYSGYFTVDEAHDSNMFFWYFPVEKKPLNETPLIIWLQGGPGATSMTGLFDEIGPFSFSAQYNLTKNPNTWLQNHSLLFIDNPVGTGFSFADENGYVTDMNTYGKNLYDTMKQFFEVFPELRTAPLFVAGESYAGKYVPALAIEIHRHKTAPGGDINLQGMILGNPYIDPEMLIHVTRPFYYFGLLDNQQISSLRPLLDGFQKDVQANRSVAAKDKWTRIIVLLILLSHQQHAYNFLRDDLGVGAYHTFLERPDVRHALHVGDTKFHFISLKVNTKLAPDFLSSAKHMYEELLDEYRVLTYCGQLDQMLPCAHTTEHYHTWRWNSYEEFHNSTRYPFLFKGKLAGYHKTGGRLTEVVIRGAGHMVPVDRAAPLRDLVTRWVHQQPLSNGFGAFTSSFIHQIVKNNTEVEALPFI